jgi:hypothetical protein
VNEVAQKRATGEAFMVAIAAIEVYAANRATLETSRSVDLAMKSDPAAVVSYVRDMTRYALNAAAEYQTRGDVRGATDRADEAARYEHLEYQLLRESVRRENVTGLIRGLNNLRTDISASNPVRCNNEAEVNALLNAAYGGTRGSELLTEVSAGLKRGDHRETTIRNAFTLSAEQSAAGVDAFSVAVLPGKTAEVKAMLLSAIKTAQDSLHLETATPNDIATANEVSPSTAHIRREHNHNNNSTQDARTETDAKIMATKTAKSKDASISTVHAAAKTAVVKARATVARTPKVRNTGKAKEAETVASAEAVASVEQPIAMESVVASAEGEKPLAFNQDVQFTKATPEEIKAALEVSQPLNASDSKDVHWSRQTGGMEGLSPSAKEQASVEYAAFGQKNPGAAAKYTVDQYVAFRQTKHAERQAITAKAISTIDEPEAKVAREADVPSEKHWSRQANFAEMSPEQKASAAVDYAKFGEKNPDAAKKHDLASYANYVIDRSAENRSLGLGLRRCEANVERGAVSFADNKQADAFLKEVYNQQRTGVDALRVLQASVEPGQAKTESFKGTFNITVERSADNKIVRTTLTPVAGKEAAVKELMGAAAAKSFARSRSEPKIKQREEKQQQNDLGR